jgi:hypothetical protein
MLNNKLLAISISIALISGCGGGGGGTASGPVTSTLSFPLQSGVKTLIANGMSRTFTISGTCSGSGTVSRSAANTPSTFETVTGFSATETINFSYTNCTPASTAQTATLYYDSSYNALGLNSPGVNYGVWLVAPSIPTSVAVGQTAVVGTETLYTDNTKTVPNGRIDASYVILADTATTAIVDEIDKGYDSAGTLIYTEQDHYRIDSTGTLTATSVDIQAANGSTNHLVWTFN